ncbi:hypothetical protein ACHAC9_23605 [Massilia sp. CMS3.1]|uniref:hypothetical protein n=1 Tax=Massilia sp. CMS3.1 TaxID=3373083 RepID=UPI003EE4A631
MSMLEKKYISEITDEFGNVVSRLDFENLGISLRIAEVLKESFDALTGQNSQESRRQTWRCLKKFAKFIISDHSESKPILNNETLAEFRGWLATQPLADSTRQSHFNDVKRSLAWIGRNRSDVLPYAHSLDVAGFYRQEPESATPLSEADTKAILRACYLEIDEIVSRLECGKKILSSNELTQSESDLKRLLVELLELGAGDIPIQSKLNSRGSGFSNRPVLNLFGLAAVTEMLFLVTKDILPFYVAILIQCAGNPMAIQHMNRDCVKGHPVRTDRRRVTWMKPRANREQLADFASHRPRNAANLIDQLLLLNAGLVERAPRKFKGKLFIARTRHGVSVPCAQTLHNLLKNFISKNELIDFDFEQCRATNGTLHFEETDDIGVAQRRLNHASPRTTVIYARQSLSRRNDRLISRFQGLLILESENGVPSTPVILPTANPKRQPRLMSTLFGFDCKDPFAGIAPGSVPGKRCPKFNGCAGCSGSIVVLDDLHVLAKLLMSSKILGETRNRATAEGWRERFNAVYGGMQEIIDNELLPKANRAMIEKAYLLMGSINIPTLE